VLPFPGTELCYRPPKQTTPSLGEKVVGGDCHQPGGAGYRGGFVGEEKRGVNRGDIGEQAPTVGHVMEDEEEEDEEEEEEENEDADVRDILSDFCAVARKSERIA